MTSSPTNLLVDKAVRSIEAAALLFNHGDFDFAASRAYYAMFYVAEAALLIRHKTFSKHSGVLSGFYQEFVATGEFSKELHQSFHQAFEDRNESDYSFLDPFPEAEAKTLLKNAKVFVATIQKWISSQPSTS